MRFVISILSGTAAAIVAALPLAWFGSGLHPWSAWIALLCGLAVFLVIFPEPQSPVIHPPSTFSEWGMIAMFTLASFRAFSMLIYSEGDVWKVLSPNNLGDLSLHLSLIRWLAATPHWWPASPILAGDPLRYPPGSDLFDALLLSVGVPAEAGLIFCGMAGAALAGIALWRWGGAVALAAFLFNGGFAGWVLITGGWGVDPDSTTQWKNLFLTLFVTQRGFLFALPAVLLLLTSWREEFFSSSGKALLPLSAGALLLSVMPLFNVHAALFLGSMMAGLFLLLPKENQQGRESLLRLAMISWPFMGFFGWLVTSGAGGPSALESIGWKPGWMSTGSIGFWFWNFGIALPLGLLLCAFLFRRGSSSEARVFVWPSAALFLLCLLVRFAPWPWDNTKLMLWSWITIAPYLWRELLANRPLLIRAVASLLLFGSGALTLVMGLDGRHGYELIRVNELSEAKLLLQDVSPAGLISCAPEYNHPVLMLGHPVVCGYEGHLWSHGLDYRERLAALENIMMGEEGWQEKARQLGVARIYWSDREWKRWPGSKLPWAKQQHPSLHKIP